LFEPVEHEGRVLVDGNLVNPVPVSLTRAMGADMVIAVDLGSDLLSRRTCLANDQATTAESCVSE
jgi:NTE family protein